MRTKAPLVGDIVHCIFWDHAQDAKDALKFEIFGRVTEITKRSYKIHYWRYVDAVDAAADNNRGENEDCYCIVKKAIESIKVLR